MKPVSVTVGMSADDVAIEACFERSMISDLDKLEDQNNSSRSNGARTISDQRDDGMLLESSTSDARNVVDTRLMAWSEEHRDDTDLTKENSASGIIDSRSSDSFIEAEFEMVLQKWDMRWGQQAQASFQELSQETDNCTNQVATVDDDEEEKVVVWSAEPDVQTSSRSVDSEIEDGHQVENGGSNDDIQVLPGESDFDQTLSTDSIRGEGNRVESSSPVTPLLATECSLEEPGGVTEDNSNTTLEGCTTQDETGYLTSLSKTLGLTLASESSTAVTSLEYHADENIANQCDTNISESIIRKSSKVPTEDNLGSPPNSVQEANPSQGSIMDTLGFTNLSQESLLVPSISCVSNEKLSHDDDTKVSELTNQDSCELEVADNADTLATAREGAATTQDNLEHMETFPAKQTSALALSTLIHQRNWESVIERVKEWSSLTTTSINEQTTLFGCESVGDSLFHEICKNQPAAEVIQLWLQVKRDDVEKSGIVGHLPLHYACGFGASLDVIDTLVDAFPEALTTPDNHERMLPLHFACREGAESGVLDFLLMAYPEATLVQDINGMTPMDYAMRINDPVVRNQTVYSIQNGLKQNLSALSNFVAKSKAIMTEEQEKVQRLQEELEFKDKRAEEDNSMLEYALEKVEDLEKSEVEKSNQIDNLRQKVEALESQLTETQLLLAAEKKRIVVEKTRELESALKIEQCKNSALEQSLAAKQEMLENEKERTKDSELKLSEIRTLLQNEKQASKRLAETLSLEQEKAKRLEEEKAKKIAEEMKKAREDPIVQKVDPCLELEIEAENAQELELDRIRSEIEAKMDENQEAIKALEGSNAKKQAMLDEQQEKVESLERVRREKETLLQKSQEVMKSLEESIERKLALQKSEEEKIRQLDNLRQKKREMIESEEEQVRKLDYTLGRKQALLELEQMKEKTLQQTIARKNALLESELSKVKELEKICAERKTLLSLEQNMVKALSTSKKDKEMLLSAERELVNELYRIHSEKEALLEMKRKTQEEIDKRLHEIEVMLEQEKKLLEQTEKVRKEKEASLLAVDVVLREIELKLSKKSQLLSKEQNIAESLERFQRRRIELASSGRLYALVDATLSISHLVKEAFLAKQHDKSLIEERKPEESSVVSKAKPSAPGSLLRKALSTNGRRYISHFAGYLGISPTIRRKYLR